MEREQDVGETPPSPSLPSMMDNVWPFVLDLLERSSKDPKLVVGQVGVFVNFAKLLLACLAGMSEGQEKESSDLLASLQAMPSNWASSSSSTTTEASRQLTREEEDEWLLGFVNAVVAWLNAQAKPGSAVSKTPFGFVCGIMPFAARWIERTVLFAPQPWKRWLPFTEDTSDEVFILYPPNDQGEQEPGAWIDTNERIVCVCLYVLPLPPHVHSFRKNIMPLRPLGAAMWDIYQFGPRWQGRAPMLPPNHFFLVFKTESGRWYMIGKGKTGLDFFLSEEDHNAPLPSVLLSRMAEGAPGPAELLDQRVWPGEDEDEDEGDDGDRPQNDDNTNNNRAKVYRRERSQRATVRQVLDHASRHPKPAGHWMFVGLLGARMVLGGPCTRAELDEVHDRIQDDGDNCFNFLYRLASAVFQVRYDLDDYFAEDFKRQMSPPYCYG